MENSKTENPQNLSETPVDKQMALQMLGFVRMRNCLLGSIAMAARNLTRGCSHPMVTPQQAAHMQQIVEHLQALEESMRETKQHPMSKRIMNVSEPICCQAPK